MDDLDKNRAEAIFKKKAQQASEAAAARSEYEEKSRATRERTAQLRALRLAREAANQESPVETKRSRTDYSR